MQSNNKTKLYNFNELYTIAQERGFNAVGSFNLHCIEMLPAFFEAAKKENCPLMIQISSGTAEYLGHKFLVDSIKSLSENNNVPACLHLDHCTSFADIQIAVEAGFSSVMYDGSHLPLEDNIKNTQEVVAYARPFHVTVEGELGVIGGTEDGVTINERDIAYTSVEDARQYIKSTSVDMLAISVGTMHGLYKGKAHVNHERLKEIAALSNTPLVLHGGTGVSNDDMYKAIQNGIKKVNVGTEMNVQWVQNCQNAFSSGKASDSVRKFLIPANMAVRDVLIDKIKLFA